MSSVTLSIPSCSAKDRAMFRLAGSLSRSGMNRPRTCFGPTASTARAAQTELSTPPLMPTTSPRRLRDVASCSLSVSHTRDTTAAGSISRAASVADIVSVVGQRINRRRHGDDVRQITRFASLAPRFPLVVLPCQVVRIDQLASHVVDMIRFMLNPMCGTFATAMMGSGEAAHTLSLRVPSPAK